MQTITYKNTNKPSGNLSQFTFKMSTTDRIKYEKFKITAVNIVIKNVNPDAYGATLTLTIDTKQYNKQVYSESATTINITETDQTGGCISMFSAVKGLSTFNMKASIMPRINYPMHANTTVQVVITIDEVLNGTTFHITDCVIGGTPSTITFVNEDLANVNHELYTYIVKTTAVTGIAGTSYEEERIQVGMTYGLPKGQILPEKNTYEWAPQFYWIDYMKYTDSIRPLMVIKTFDQNHNLISTDEHYFKISLAKVFRPWITQIHAERIVNNKYLYDYTYGLSGSPMMVQNMTGMKVVVRSYFYSFYDTNYKVKYSLSMLGNTTSVTTTASSAQLKINNINAAGDLTCVVRVQDERGRYSEKTFIVYVTPYTKPTISDTACFRCSKDNGQYIADEKGIFGYVKMTGGVSPVYGFNKLLCYVGWSQYPDVTDPKKLNYNQNPYSQSGFPNVSYAQNTSSLVDTLPIFHESYDDCVYIPAIDLMQPDGYWRDLDSLLSGVQNSNVNKDFGDDDEITFQDQIYTEEIIQPDDPFDPPVQDDDEPQRPDYSGSVPSLDNVQSYVVNGQWTQIGGWFVPSLTYYIYFVVWDAYANYTMTYKPLRTEMYAIHVMNGGNGVAFGKISEQKAAVQIAEDWSLFMGKTQIKPPFSIAAGGTGGKTRAKANANLNYTGVNPISSKTQDRPTQWMKLGVNTVSDCSAGSYLNNPPSTQGIIETLTNGEDHVSQLWFAKPPVGEKAKMYMRYGYIDTDGNSAWSARNKMWSEVFTQNSVVPIENGGTGATTAEQARTNLGVDVGSLNVVSQIQYPASKLSSEMPDGLSVIPVTKGSMSEYLTQESTVINLNTGNQFKNLQLSFDRYGNAGFRGQSGGQMLDWYKFVVAHVNSNNNNAFIIRTGSCTVKGGSATNVSFGNDFKYRPFVFANYTENNTTVTEGTFGVLKVFNLKNTGCSIRPNDSNTTQRNVHWIAIGN